MNIPGEGVRVERTSGSWDQSVATHLSPSGLRLAWVANYQAARQSINAIPFESRTEIVVHAAAGLKNPWEQAFMIACLDCRNPYEVKRLVHALGLPDFQEALITEPVVWTALRDPGVTLVGDDVQASGMFDLSNAKSLLVLPPGLRALAGVSLYGCSNLVEIQADIRGHGNPVCMAGCSSLRRVPDGVVVGDLRDCHSLEEVPGSLDRTGDVYLRGGRLIKKLPEWLAEVGGQADFGGMESLESLAGFVRSGGCLNCSGNGALRELAEGLSVGGRAIFIDCRSLRRLPKGFRFTDYLNLSGCESLEELLEDMDVPGFLALRGCKSLRHLPQRLRTAEDMDVSDCTALTRITPVKCGGNLRAVRCTSLVEIDPMVELAASLHLDYCTSLEETPDGLVVPGDFHLKGCGALRKLGRRTRVGGNLVLQGCYAFEGVPHDLEVGGQIKMPGKVRR